MNVGNGETIQRIIMRNENIAFKCGLCLCEWFINSGEHIDTSVIVLCTLCMIENVLER